MKILVTGLLLLCMVFLSDLESSSLKFRVLNPELQDGDTAIVQMKGLDPELTYTVSLLLSEPIVFPVREIKKRTIILLPVPFRASPQLLWVLTEQGTGQVYTNIMVVSKRPRKRSNLTVADKYVSPSSALIQKIKKEKKLSDRAKSVRTDFRFYDSDPVFPLTNSLVSSFFGDLRRFNDKRDSVHYGLDIMADTGTPVYSIYAGRVVLTGNFYYSGKSVIIDHGQGLVTVYFHLSSILVGQGDQIGKGERIGRVGMTGRVTGPHLHFGVYLYRIPVDPLRFYMLMKEYYPEN